LKLSLVLQLAEAFESDKEFQKEKEKKEKKRKKRKERKEKKEKKRKKRKNIARGPEPQFLLSMPQNWQPYVPLASFFSFFSFSENFEIVISKYNITIKEKASNLILLGF